MEFKEQELVFQDDKIVMKEHSDQVVMMKWEDEIMKKSAEYICQSKGDILEIGFGMGICSDYIQAQGVNSHTIVEIHPQIIEMLNTWASNKNNVTIIEGDWVDIVNDTKYDGIFLDTFWEFNGDRYKDFVLAKSNDGANVTYWNNYEKEDNGYNFDNVSFEKVAVSPDDNPYTDIKDHYYMPKVKINGDN